MFRKIALASSLAVFCAGVAAGAQQPTPDARPDATQQQPAGQQPATQQPRATPEQTTTVEGCVYHERDIPGRTPNVAERAGILEDYILVASAASGSTPGATGTTGTTGSAAPASGAAKMFKLEHKPDHQLSAMVGKRVQVTGKIDAERSDSTGAAAATRQQDKSVGPDRINLPEFEITSIREAKGECPAKPQMSK